MAIQFRQQALDHLSSPDQLDKLFRVVKINHWILVSFCLLLLSLAVAWSIWGRLTVEVQGNGLLVHNDSEIFVVPATVAGRLSHFTVTNNQWVEKEQTLAQLDQPLLHQQLLGLKIKRDRLLEDWRVHHENHQKFKHLKTKSDQQRIQSYYTELALAKEAYLSLTQLVDGQQKLLEKGSVSLMQFMETKQKLVNATQQVADLEDAIRQLSTQNIEQERSFLSSAAAMDQQFTQVDGDIQQTQLTLKQQSSILSPTHAKVVSLIANPGNYVQPGAPIIQLSSGSGRFDILLYVPVGSAKQIRLGDTVKFSPSSYSPNEYGFLLGKVELIADLPVSKEKLFNSLGNEQLVEQFLKAGASIEIRVQLDSEAQNTSTSELHTYHWTSQKGQQIMLSSGMIGTAQIVVEHKRPIELVLPTLKDWLGV